MNHRTQGVGRLIATLALASGFAVLMSGCGGGGGGGAAVNGTAAAGAPAPAALPESTSALRSYAQDYTLMRVGWFTYDASHSTVPLAANVQLSLDDKGQVTGYFSIQDCAVCEETIATNGSPTYSATGNYCMGHNGPMPCLSEDTATNAAGVSAGVQLMGMPAFDPYSGAPTYHAFSGNRDLGTLGGTNSYATGINAAGEVVGYSDTPGNGGTQAFLFRGGVMHALTIAGATQSHANAINADGQIAGNATGSVSAVSHGFFYADGAVTDLGEGQANALNNSGQVAGSNSAGAFLTGPNGATRTGIGPGTAVSVNAAGQVVVNGTGPFLWDGATQVNLNAIIAPSDALAGAVTLTSAIAINSSGQILVNGHDKDGWQLQFLLSPPPIATQLETLLALVRQFDGGTGLAPLVSQVQVYSAAGVPADTCVALAAVENDLVAGPAKDDLPATVLAPLRVDVRLMMSTVGCAY